MIGRAVVFVAIAASVGCHHNGGGAAERHQDGTELRGTVSVVGTGFDQRLQIESNGDITRLAVSPADSAALTRLGGVEVAVSGTMESRVLRVANFRAVSVSGTPVVDGIVRVDGQMVMLETPTGRVLLGNPPAPLRQLDGARVWVSGPIDKGPNSYGVIAPVR